MTQVDTKETDSQLKTTDLMISCLQMGKTMPIWPSTGISLEDDGAQT